MGLRAIDESRVIRPPNGSGRPLEKDSVAKLDRKAWDRGAIVYARGNVLRLAPPLCITREEVDTWMTALLGEALTLQRPLPDDALMIVARGEKKDEGGLAA